MCWSFDAWSWWWSYLYMEAEWLLRLVAFWYSWKLPLVPKSLHGSSRSSTCSRTPMSKRSLWPPARLGFHSVVIFRWVRIIVWGKLDHQVSQVQRKSLRDSAMLSKFSIDYHICEPWAAIGRNWTEVFRSVEIMIVFHRPNRRAIEFFCLALSTDLTQWTASLVSSLSSLSSLGHCWRRFL
jgi:hypothetical protein